MPSPQRRTAILLMSCSIARSKTFAAGADSRLAQIKLVLDLNRMLAIGPHINHGQNAQGQAAPRR
jgi:hypothetical protein